MSPIQRILGMITHLPHFLKSLRAVCYSPHPCCTPLLWGDSSWAVGCLESPGCFNLQGNGAAEDKNGHFSSFHLLAQGPCSVFISQSHLRLLPGSFGVLWGFHGNAECCGAVPELCWDTWAPGFVLENYLYQHLY